MLALARRKEEREEGGMPGSALAASEIRTCTLRPSHSHRSLFTLYWINFPSNLSGNTDFMYFFFPVVQVGGCSEVPHSPNTLKWAPYLLRCASAGSHTPPPQTPHRSHFDHSLPPSGHFLCMSISCGSPEVAGECSVEQQSNAGQSTVLEMVLHSPKQHRRVSWRYCSRY